MRLKAFVVSLIDLLERFPSKLNPNPCMYNYNRAEEIVKESGFLPEGAVLRFQKLEIHPQLLWVLIYEHPNFTLIQGFEETESFCVSIKKVPA